MIELIFATQNQNKVKEVQSIIPSWIKILSLADLGFHDELVEDYETLEQNAEQKATFIYKRFLKPCFAEDAGLGVASLNGEPGVFSARYAAKNKSSNDNIVLLLKKLNGIENREARFRAVIAFNDGKPMKRFEGICNGRIAEKRLGDYGFGYDPVFIPHGYDKTFGQLSPDIKHRISHRTKATQKFITFIENLWSETT